jgi:DnaJ-class molecular chaperone
VTRHDEIVYRTAQLLLPLQERDCPDCMGTGESLGVEKTCLHCHGTGRFIHNDAAMADPGYYDRTWP